MLPNIKAFSRQERMERFCARIQGGNLDSKTASKRSKRSAAHNLFFGVALHAAFRTSQGKPLSPLEESLLAELRALCEDDEEISHYGACYERVKEQARASGEQAIFPACILDLGSDEPYTGKRLRQDLRYLTEEVSQVIDISKLVEGYSVDREEYLAALAAAGGIGATILTAPDRSASSRAGRQNDDENDDDDEVPKLRLKSFRCLEKFRPGGEKEDIYWGFASGSDRNVENDGVTETIKDIAENQPYHLGHTFFEGEVDNHVVAHITCWEARNGDSAWLDGVKDMLQKLRKHCVDAAVRDVDWEDEDSEGRTDGSAAVTVVAALAANYIEELFMTGLPYDNPLASRNIGFTRKGLDFFLEQPLFVIRLDFAPEDDQGRYQLEIERVHEGQFPGGNQRVFSSNDGQRWSDATPVEGDVQSYRGMVMAKCLETLYGIFPNMENQLCITHLEDDGTWAVPTLIGG